MIRSHRSALPLLGLIVVASAEAACLNASTDSGPLSPSAESADGGGTLLACSQNSDCPSGLTCENERCVANDGEPPEQKDNGIFDQPQNSAHYVFALSPTYNTVAVIDPTTLAIRSIPLPEDPVGLAVIPGQDAAVIVEQSGTSVSFISCNAASCQLQSQATPRPYPAVSVSADGQWAILWTPDPDVPADGAEGVVALVDVSGLAAGTPVPIVERATGRRDTNAFFRMSAGAAVDAVVVAEDGVAIMDLSQLAAQPLPTIVMLPSDFTSVDSRESVTSPDGSWVLLESLASMNVGLVDVAGQTVDTLAMPDTPTDVEITPDGSTGVAVIRGTGQTAWFPLPGVLSDPTTIQMVTVSLPADGCTDTSMPCTASPGQAVISSDGTLAALFTNAVPTEAFATLELASGNVSTFDGLAKIVDTLGIGPDDHSVMVLHTPVTDSTSSDPYQQMVDESQGFSVVDLDAGVAELTLTDTVPPIAFVFAGDDDHAAVTLSDGTSHFGLDVVDLQSLVTTSISLPDAPVYSGTFPSPSPTLWVTQNDPTGRISFVDSATDNVQTASGYALNAGISP